MSRTGAVSYRMLMAEQGWLDSHIYKQEEEGHWFYFGFAYYRNRDVTPDISTAVKYPVWQKLFVGRKNIPVYKILYMQWMSKDLWPVGKDSIQLRRTCEEPACISPFHRITKYARSKKSYQKKYKPADSYINRGEKHRLAKLTEADVVEIRRRGVQEYAKNIAADYGVHPTTIGDILSHKTWKKRNTMSAYLDELHAGSRMESIKKGGGS